MRISRPSRRTWLLLLTLKYKDNRFSILGKRGFGIRDGPRQRASVAKPLYKTREW
jgi:hypothetical protein